MDRNILFSIIIPTYNRASFISKSIQSVLDQEYSILEVIVVDDGSTDNTKEVVERFEDDRIRYYKKKNGERGAARNFGTVRARGDYITFLDSDDLVYPNHLTQALISAKKDYMLFHQAYDIRDEKGTIIRKVNQLKGNIREKLIKENFFSCIGMFIRNDIAKVYIFNETRELSGLEDWELWLRLGSRFQIKINNTITSTLVNHNDRSVLTVDEQSLVQKNKVMISQLTKDKTFMKCYGGKIHRLEASLNSYTALHLSFDPTKKWSPLYYLFQAILLDPMELVRKRFLVIIKCLLINH